MFLELADEKCQKKGHDADDSAECAESEEGSGIFSFFV